MYGAKVPTRFQFVYKRVLTSQWSLINIKAYRVSAEKYALYVAGLGVIFPIYFSRVCVLVSISDTHALLYSPGTFTSISYFPNGKDVI